MAITEAILCGAPLRTHAAKGGASADLFNCLNKSKQELSLHWLHQLIKAQTLYKMLKSWILSRSHRLLLFTPECFLCVSQEFKEWPAAAENPPRRQFVTHGLSQRILPQGESVCSSSHVAAFHHDRDLSDCVCAQGVLFVLLQHQLFSSVEVEEKSQGEEEEARKKMALLSLVAVNPLSGKSVLATQLCPPSAWSGR